jgi:hypothetical protein
MIRAMRFHAAITLPALLFGCSLITDVDRPVEFSFEELQAGHNFEETLDVNNIGSDIFFLGHLKTPHACFSLRPSFLQQDSVLTLRVTAQATNSQCPTMLGGYRYSGAIRAVRSGVYDFRVIHTVPGQADQTQSVSITIR